MELLTSGLVERGRYDFERKDCEGTGGVEKGGYEEHPHLEARSILPHLFFLNLPLTDRMSLLRYPRMVPSD